MHRRLLLKLMLCRSSLFCFLMLYTSWTFYTEAIYLLHLRAAVARFRRNIEAWPGLRLTHYHNNKKNLHLHTEISANMRTKQQPIFQLANKSERKPKPKPRLRLGPSPPRQAAKNAALTRPGSKLVDEAGLTIRITFPASLQTQRVLSFRILTGYTSIHGSISPSGCVGVRSEDSIVWFRSQANRETRETK